MLLFPHRHIHGDPVIRADGIWIGTSLQHSLQVLDHTPFSEFTDQTTMAQAKRRWVRQDMIANPSNNARVTVGSRIPERTSTLRIDHGHIGATRKQLMNNRDISTRTCIHQRGLTQRTTAIDTTSAKRLPNIEHIAVG
jgi:hypothetical protein